MSPRSGSRRSIAGTPDRRLIRATHRFPRTHPNTLRGRIWTQPSRTLARKLSGGYPHRTPHRRKVPPPSMWRDQFDVSLFGQSCVKRIAVIRLFPLAREGSLPRTIASSVASTCVTSWSPTLVVNGDRKTVNVRKAHDSRVLAPSNLCPFGMPRKHSVCWGIVRAQTPRTLLGAGRAGGHCT